MTDDAKPPKDNDKPLHGQYDKTYRLLYSYPEMVADTLRFIKEPWVDELDFSSLKKMAESHVSERLDLRFQDVVWQVRWKGTPVYLCLLVEFQSTVDPYMVVRILLYVALFYDDLVRQLRDQDADDPDVVVRPGEEGEKRRRHALLPLVIPVLIYNGRPLWWASLDMAKLIRLPAEGMGLERFIPHVATMLVDERQLPEDELEQFVHNLFAELVRLERASSPDEVHQQAEELGWIPNPAVRRAFAVFMKASLNRMGLPREALSRIDDDLGEVTNMLAENLIEWRDNFETQAIAKGREKGLHEGEARALTRQAQLKFGPLDNATRQRIADADSEVLERWLGNVLTAEKLADVFKDS